MIKLEQDLQMNSSLCQKQNIRKRRIQLGTHFFHKKLALGQPNKMVKKLSVLKPWRLRNLKIYLSFSYCSFEDTAISFDKDIFRKNLSVIQTLIVN